jgi:2,2-dialkylglycine decarboxylase (pyruvate)
VPTEAELLTQAATYAFRARMDKKIATGPVFASAHGSVVTDVNGKDYLDFNSGQMCAALGHNHPTVVAAIRDACDTMLHAYSSHYNVREIELAARLGGLVPRPLQKSLFGESGSDANEMAMMIARKFTGGHEIASPHISFHGLSDATRAVTFAGWHAGHGALPGGTAAMVAPYCYRCPLAQTYPGCDFACLTTSFALLDAQSTGRPAAVITEPLFSAGGVVEPPRGWLTRLHALCRARGMLLIVDEEQTGLGKLGQMFAFESEGVVPDIITIAKHFGGGIGLSAVITTAAIEEKVVAEGYSSTHSHSNDPLICAAGIASLDVVSQEDRSGQGAPDRRTDARAAGCADAALRHDRRHSRPRPVDRHRVGARPRVEGAGDRGRARHWTLVFRARPYFQPAPGGQRAPLRSTGDDHPRPIRLGDGPAGRGAGNRLGSANNMTLKGSSLVTSRSAGAYFRTKKKQGQIRRGGH